LRSYGQIFFRQFSPYRKSKKIKGTARKAGRLKKERKEGRNGVGKEKDGSHGKARFTPRSGDDRAIGEEDEEGLSLMNLTKL
jgi:hypothetical protein